MKPSSFVIRILYHPYILPFKGVLTMAQMRNQRVEDSKASASSAKQRLENPWAQTNHKFERPYIIG